MTNRNKNPKIVNGKPVVKSLFQIGRKFVWYGWGCKELPFYRSDTGHPFVFYAGGYLQVKRQLDEGTYWVMDKKTVHISSDVKVFDQEGFEIDGVSDQDFYFGGGDYNG